MQLYKDVAADRVRCSFDLDGGLWMHISSVSGLFWGCMCAACSQCLRQSGKMPKRWFGNPRVGSKGWC